MFLLTPGPLTTHPDTRAAMAHDWGSRDRAFVELSASVCRDLAALAPGEDLACVPMQGSGTFAVEAAVGTLVPREGRLLVLHNGSYGARIVEICRRIGRGCVAIESDELAPLSPAKLDALLAGDPGITHVALVHVETGAGLANPLAELVAVARARGRGTIVDAMSSFGALPLVAADAIVAASGKCLEGPPGMGFAIVRRAALAAARGNAHSLALDLADQHAAIEATGQWRFTPPTQIVAALRVALDRLATEGGPAARLARYQRNCDQLVAGMAALGFAPVLPAHLQAPIIVSFHGSISYERMRARGFIVYPGKLVGQITFRIGCIGALPETAIADALAAICDSLVQA